MDKQGAIQLAAQIERRGGGKARATYDAKSGEWVAATPDGTFNGPFAWHYQQAQIKQAMRKLKHMRWRVLFG